MKKTNWLIWIGFTAVSAGLRAWQTLAGYEAGGLAKRGFVPGILLLFVLLASAVCFAVRARSLPGKRADAFRLSEDFRFADNLPAVLLAVTGSFLVLLGGGLYVLRALGSLAPMLLGLFAAVAAVCGLYTVFALYRGDEVQSLALLAPICALVVFVVYVYRADASDPVLARTYIEILAVAALTFSAAQRAAFVFGGSAMRCYVSVSEFAALLALCAAAEEGTLARAALYIGCAAIELGFLAAAKPEE